MVISPAERILGRVSGFPGRRVMERCLLMLKAYIDGSGTGAKDVLVLAGFIATADQWLEFSKDWDRFLVMRLGPRPRRYFKMKEMKNDLETCALHYRVIEEHAVAAVSCMIRTSGLIDAVRGFPWPFKFDRDGTKRLENPYYFGFKAIMDKLAQNQVQLKITEPIDFVFDEESEKRRCLESWDRMKFNASADVRRLLGSTPIFQDDITTMPLQAADLYAWWVREWELQGVKNAIETLPFPWEKERDIPRIEIRFEKRDFMQEFQKWCDDPDLIRRMQMTDEEVAIGLQDLREWDHIQMNPATPPVPSVNIEAVKSESFVKFYANSVNIESSIWDFKLTFGEQSVKGPGQLHIEQPVAIFMSPQHAKVLSRLLANRCMSTKNA